MHAVLIVDQSWAKKLHQQGHNKIYTNNLGMKQDILHIVLVELLCFYLKPQNDNVHKPTIKTRPLQQIWKTATFI